MKTPYLKDNRLYEVIGLIQVLAFDIDTSRSETGIASELSQKPISGSSWIQIATEHPKLFRVRSGTNQKKRAALISRYVLEYEDHEEHSKGKRPPLDPNLVTKLIDTAIELHDRQLQRKEKWKVIVPMLVAVIAAIAAITSAFIGNS
ncbi:hypothetical protein [uncultured Dokdonia sp.]|uniref:hypothetical protein n=1 Tax=uncultured Dokdonia sp. TaxID=575653 RepID=UPI002632717A|nr:hypothetical protein [uncultured Dokdonia sp.]